jgi:GntR family transcriptional regulator
VIDNAQALPLYHQVAGILRQRIEDGIYPVGGKLLSEDELAAEFEVSRATIRQAVGELVIEGLVVRRQGRGTYVEARDVNVLQQRFRGSLGDLINESQRAKTRNVDVAHDAPIPVHIAEALQLDSPTGTIVKRTRIMDGQPFALTITYLPSDLGKMITPAGLRRRALMELLMDSGISLSSASQSIRAQLADLDVCTQIDVELGAAVLFVERIVHDTAGRPVEYVRSWYRGDRYEYAVTLDLAPGQDGNPYRKLALRAAAADQVVAATRAARAMARRSSATASGGSSLALCGVELSRPNVACTAARRRPWAARGVSSLSTVTHSST